LGRQLGWANRAPPCARACPRAGNRIPAARIHDTRAARHGQRVGVTNLVDQVSADHDRLIRTRGPSAFTTVTFAITRTGGNCDAHPASASSKQETESPKHAAMTTVFVLRSSAAQLSLWLRVQAVFEWGLRTPDPRTNYHVERIPMILQKVDQAPAKRQNRGRDSGVSGLQEYTIGRPNIVGPDSAVPTTAPSRARAERGWKDVTR
jgi:hypothetical protein